MFFCHSAKGSLDGETQRPRSLKSFLAHFLLSEQRPQRLEVIVDLDAEDLGEAVDDDDGVAVGIERGGMADPLEDAVVTRSILA